MVPDRQKGRTDGGAEWTDGRQNYIPLTWSGDNKAQFKMTLDGAEHYGIHIIFHMVLIKAIMFLLVDLQTPLL